jgi:hypothetical protein
MATTVTKTARAVRKATASPLQSDPSLDPLGGDRRCVVQVNVAIDARKNAVRKRYVDPTICVGEFAAAEQEFLQAMQEYKKRSGRMFPTWSEVLEVLQNLGYEKPLREVAGERRSFTDGKNLHLESEQSRRGVNHPAA